LGNDLEAAVSNLDIDKIEALTDARKKTWQALHQAIGADAAAVAHAKRCREALSAAAEADEKAGAALYTFMRSQVEEAK
jgi:hypothetical protein